MKTPHLTPKRHHSSHNPILTRVIHRAISFFFPVAALCTLCTLRGIYPFGQESFLTADCWYQYVDFFTWYRSVLHGEGSFAYTAALSLGANAWGIFSYYLSSPFNLLILLFDNEHVVLGIFVICAVKLGLIQTSASYYLERRFGISFSGSFVLALCFTLCGWVVTSLHNLLWLDMCYLAPIAMLFCWKFLSSGRINGIAIAVGTNIMMCWYTGYMTCIFLCLYVLFEAYCMHADDPNIQLSFFFRRAGLFAVAMIVAVGLSAWSFFPTIMAMAGNSAPFLIDPRLIVSPKRLMGGFFTGTYEFENTPQLFSSSLALLLVGCFVFCKNIPLKKRVAFLVFFFILLASVDLTTLYYVWCGFRAPNGFYCRIASFISLALVWAAGYAWRSIEDGAISVHAAAKSTAVLLVLVLALLVRNGFNSYTAALIAFVILGIDSSILFLCTAKDAYHRLPLSFIFICLCTVELIYNAWYDWPQIYANHPQEADNAYVAQAREELSVINDSDQDVFRIEKTFTRAYNVACNEGLAHGYLQLSSYCSAHNEDAVQFLCALGYSNPGEVSVRYSSPIATSDSFLGIRYVIENGSDYDPLLYEVVPMENGDHRILRNPYALAFGFFASRDVVGFSYDYRAENPFELQNRIFSAVLGEKTELYTPITAISARQASGALSWQVDAPAGEVAYCYIRGGIKRGFGAYMSIDGSNPFYENSRFSHSIRLLGEGNHEVVLGSSYDTAANKSQEASLSWFDGMECLFYSLNQDSFIDVMSRIGQHQARFISFSDGAIEASIEAPSDGYMLLTIPNEHGWSVQVNGESVVPEDAFDGACMAIPIKAGTNSVSMSFSVPGMHAGVLVTLLSAALLLAINRAMRKASEKTIRVASSPSNCVDDNETRLHRHG